jgi:hypothetical protein
MRAALVVAAALLLAPTTAERVEVTGGNVQSLYKSFHRLTAEPMQVSARLSAACAPPTGDPLAQEVERAGPHARALVHLYSHGVDDSLFASPERQFPVGTIVVKEKLAADLTTTGVGGMQKMAPGYDPEGGDWLYFYSSRSGRFFSGRLDTCRSCHLRARESDFVYFLRGHDSGRQTR